MSEMVTYPRLLIYGASGTGKTHFLGTCPKPFVFDFDNGIETLVGMNIPFQAELYEPLVPGTWERFSRRLQDFEAGRVKDIRTVAIDSLTALCDCAEAHILALNNRTVLTKTQADWGQEISIIEQVLYRMNTISKHYHVVVTSHEQLKEDAVRGETFVVPIVSGKEMPFKIPKWFGEVYRLYTDRTKEKKPDYRMMTCADRRYSAKTRLGGLLAEGEVPDYKVLLGKYATKPKAEPA